MGWIRSTGHRHPHKDGGFTVFQQFGFQNEKQDVHCALFHLRLF